MTSQATETGRSCACSQASTDATQACECQQKLCAAVPQPGQSVRVTLHKDKQVWEGSHLAITPAGTHYEGVVAECDDEGFFDITTETGERIRLYAYDTILQIEIL